MRIKKVLSVTALSSLLVISLFGFSNTFIIHAHTSFNTDSEKQVSLPYSYRGTWGTQRQYWQNIINGRTKNIVNTKGPAVLKFYKRTGYFNSKNEGNHYMAFGKDSHKGLDKGDPDDYYSFYPQNQSGAPIGLKLSKNHRIMHADMNHLAWSFHRISNRIYNSMLKQMQPKKRRWRRIRYYRTGYSDHYGHWHAYRIRHYNKPRRHVMRRHQPSQQQRYNSKFKSIYGMTPNTAHNAYTSDELAKIKNDRQEYHYLLNNEDNAGVNKSDYDQETVDWLNFFRTYIYNLSPVSEDDSYSQKSQSDIDNDTDPEDMDSSEEPGEAVEDYFTDENNEDNDGTAGHRDSILDANADLVGIGRSSTNGNSLFFNWGLDNGAANMDHTGISYPCGSVFPLADAQEAQYWSFQIYNRPYDNQGYSYPTPDIEVHDDTDNEDVPVSNITMMPNEVYYSVDTNMLRANHQYTITLTGDGVSNSGVDTITTKLFNM